VTVVTDLVRTLVVKKGKTHPR